MKTWMTLGLIGGAGFGLYGYDRFQKMKEAYKQLSFEVTEGGQIDWIAEEKKLTGYVQLTITNPTQEKFLATLSRIDLVSASGEIIGQGFPKPRVMTVAPNALTQVVIDVKIDLAEKQQKRVFGNFLMNMLRGKFDQQLCLVIEIFGKEVTHSFPVINLIEG